MDDRTRRKPSRFERPQGPPDPDEIIRGAKRRLKELAPKEPPPKAGTELWPGGPSVDTGDIRLARLTRRRKARRAAIASIRQEAT